MKIRLSKDLKARLLAAIATGVFDPDEFPEFKDAFTGLHPMSRGMAKRIMDTLNSQPVTGK